MLCLCTLISIKGKLNTDTAFEGTKEQIFSAEQNKGFRIRSHEAR